MVFFNGPSAAIVVFLHSSSMRYHAGKVIMSCTRAQNKHTCRSMYCWSGSTLVLHAQIECNIAYLALCSVYGSHLTWHIHLGCSCVLVFSGLGVISPIQLFY